MLSWLSANLATILVAAVVFGVWGFIVYRLIKNRRAGKSGCSCGGSCSGCPGSLYCHSRK